MTEAQVIALINQYIIPNGTNAITGSILNQVLIPMVQQINDKVGQLEDLETPVNTDIVAAINSILALINNGSTIHEGQPNPNITPPASYAVADFYSQVNASNNPIFLWIYTGTSWVNLSDEGLPVTQISSLNLFDDGSFETGIAGFAVSAGSGVLTNIESGLIAPRNQKMLRADMASNSAIERSLGIPVNYGGVPANFSCWVYTDDQPIEIDVMGGSTPITTIVVTPGDQWQHITYNFNIDNSAPPSLGIRVKNTNACIYNLDEMFLGAKTSEVAPTSSDISNYNLSANPSFENDIVEYSVITGSANFSFNNTDNLLSPLNKRCLKIESDTGGEFKFLFAGNPINTNVKGVYEFWMLNDQEVVILISTTGGGSVTDLIPISNVWKKHSYTFNLGSGATDIGFAVASDSNTFLDMMYVGADEYAALNYVPLDGTLPNKNMRGVFNVEIFTHFEWIDGNGDRNVLSFEDNAIQLFKYNSLGDEIGYFGFVADEGMSARDVLPPLDETYYTQKAYVDEILHSGAIEITFDGSQSVFEIPHGYDVEPSSFALTFSDGSAIDFIQGDRGIDDTNIVISCDAAPMVGSIIVYWQAFK